MTNFPDALGSKSFTSHAENLGLIGILLRRCLVVVTVLYIPVMLLWCFIGPILVFCGQSHELAYGTQTFLRCLAPCGIGYIYFECLKKFLQCQSKSVLIFSYLYINRRRMNRQTIARNGNTPFGRYSSCTSLLGRGPFLGPRSYWRHFGHWKHVLDCVSTD